VGHFHEKSSSALFIAAILYNRIQPPAEYWRHDALRPHPRKPHFSQGGVLLMSVEANQYRGGKATAARAARQQTRNYNRSVGIAGLRLSADEGAQSPVQSQAELFYLQKQIQSQTAMVLVLEDGELIEGCIEWYDRNTIKLRGRAKTLVYKSAIKYMYKLGDRGQ
jgi:sRNA-binding regulator protein Hfq